VGLDAEVPTVPTRSRMYAPKHFAQTDPALLRDAIRRFGPGELITYGSDGIEASLIPMLISDDAGTISGHQAKANRQWSRADTSVPALVIWQGADGFVSPNFYPSKLEDGKVVPTWNYLVVQARGTITFHHEREWKRSQVTALTDWHEAGSTVPWSVDDAPEDYIDGMLSAIVGFEIGVTSIEGKWKLSQNRSRQDMAGVIAGLAARHEARADELASEMAAEMAQELAAEEPGASS
jgi:transcriptional regulator